MLILMNLVGKECRGLLATNWLLPHFGHVYGSHEFYVGKSLYVFNQSFEHEQPSGASDVLGVHGQGESAPVAVEPFELRGPCLVYIVWVPHGS